VIDVSSREGSRELGGFAEVSFINAAAMLQGPIGEHGSFAIAGRRSYIDALIPLVVQDSSSLAFTALPRYYDYQARADYRFSKHVKLSGFLFGSDDKFGVTTDGQDPDQPSQLDNKQRFTRGIVSLTYDEPGLYNKLAASAMTLRNDTTLADDRFLHVKPDTISARDEARVAITDRIGIVAGGEVQATDVSVRVKLPRPPHEGDPSNPGLTSETVIDTENSRTQTDSAVWGALDVKPTGWFKATAGVRVDDFRYNRATVVEPRVQTRTTLSKETAVLAASGLYTRPPDNMDENLDPKLEPERSWQSSVGIEQKVGKGLTFTGTVYYNDRSDMLVPAMARSDGGSTDGTGAYENAGTGTSYGAELLLQARTDRFFGWAAYTFSRSKRVDRPMEEERLFDSDQTHNLIVLGSYKLDTKWQVGGRFQLTSGSPYTPVVGAVFDSDRNTYNPTYGQTNSQRNPIQHQLDVRVDRYFQFKTWKLAGYLDVQNVYVNAPVVGYQYNANYTKRTETTGIPILPSFGVRGEF
jgi:outer membrane receptor protein involved in Fe transport